MDSRKDYREEVKMRLIIILCLLSVMLTGCFMIDENVIKDSSHSVGISTDGLEDIYIELEEINPEELIVNPDLIDDNYENDLIWSADVEVGTITLFELTSYKLCSSECALYYYYSSDNLTELERLEKTDSFILAAGLTQENCKKCEGR